MIKKESTKVVFANDNLEREFYSLSENSPLRKNMLRAIRDIKENAFVGAQLTKDLIPKEYVQKYKITNLWKYDLPDGWRLVYSITTPSKIEIISVILEWFNHKEYERRFHY